MKRFEDYYEATNQMIGQGAFAQVFIAKSKQTGEKVAVKISNSNSPISQKEKEILQKICLAPPHPSVVKILDIFDNVKQKLLIVLEYCSGGTLYDQMVKNPVFQLDDINDIILQIALGVNFLHSKNIVHRDIKPENVLIQYQEGKVYYKITDFGLSSVKDYGMTTTKVGTAYYVAPEIFDGRAINEGYDKSVDLWALGLMLDELIHGSPFYNGTTEEEVFSKIISQPYNIRDENIRLATVFDAKKFLIRQVLQNIIVREPAKRKDLQWVIKQLQEFKDTQNSPMVQPEAKVYEQKFQFLPQQFTQPNNYNNIPQQKQMPSTNQQTQLAPQQPPQIPSYEPLPQLVSLQSQPLSVNLLDADDYYIPNSSSSAKVLDPQKEKCPQHGLIMNLKVPGIGDKSEQIVSACQKCLTSYGVFDQSELSQHIQQAINELQTKGFDYFYKQGSLLQQIQILFQSLYETAFLIKIKDSFYDKYSPLLQKNYEIAQRDFFEMQTQLKMLNQDQSLKVKWVNDALRHINDDSYSQNKIISEVHRKMRDRRDKALQEVKEFFKEHLRLLAFNIKSKADIL